jgi:phenylpropionate dioxygenase-like ring-hydroxylating dioxygenase large terminal subunit
VVSDLRCATGVQHHRRTQPSATNPANARSPQNQQNLAVTSTANDGRKTFTQLCLTNAANASSRQERAISSAGERSLHTREVTGSIPVSPTKISLIWLGFQPVGQDTCQMPVIPNWRPGRRDGITTTGLERASREASPWESPYGAGS